VAAVKVLLQRLHSLAGDAQKSYDSALQDGPPCVGVSRLERGELQPVAQGSLAHASRLRSSRKRWLVEQRGYRLLLCAAELPAVPLVCHRLPLRYRQATVGCRFNTK